MIQLLDMLQSTKEALEARIEMMRRRLFELMEMIGSEANFSNTLPYFEEVYEISTKFNFIMNRYDYVLDDEVVSTLDEMGRMLFHQRRSEVHEYLKLHKKI